MSWFQLFGGGVMLALAFVHMLADAEEGSPEWFEKKLTQKIFKIFVLVVEKTQFVLF